MIIFFLNFLFIDLINKYVLKIDFMLGVLLGIKNLMICLIDIVFNRCYLLRIIDIY